MVVVVVVGSGVEVGVGVGVVVAVNDNNGSDAIVSSQGYTRLRHIYTHERIIITLPARR